MTRKYFAADLLPAAAVVVIGIAEVSHICGAFLNTSFYFSTLLFGGMTAGALFLFLLLLAIRAGKHLKKAEQTAKTRDMGAFILLLIFLLLVCSQIFFLLTNEVIFRRGDMTVETVESFLRTDAVYRVNPLTGGAYQQGIPSRIKILCLPTLYGALCGLFGVPAGVLVWRVAPVLTLIGCYGAYSALSRCLFEDARKRRAFLITVALLIWAGSYLYGMDGFGILYAGWQGVTIRNMVLLPWVLSLCLRKKFLPVLLCVIAEACIVWTLYGMGVCFLVAFGMSLAGMIRVRVNARQVSKKMTGKEKAR